MQSGCVFSWFIRTNTYLKLISSQKSSATRIWKYRNLLSKAEWLDRPVKNEQKRTENKSFLEYFKSSTLKVQNNINDNFKKSNNT